MYSWSTLGDRWCRSTGCYRHAQRALKYGFIGRFACQFAEISSNPRFLSSYTTRRSRPSLRDRPARVHSSSASAFALAALPRLHRPLSLATIPAENAGHFAAVLLACAQGGWPMAAIFRGRWLWVGVCAPASRTTVCKLVVDFNGAGLAVAWPKCAPGQGCCAAPGV